MAKVDTKLLIHELISIFHGILKFCGNRPSHKSRIEYIYTSNDF